MGAYDFGQYRLAWPRMGKLPDSPDYDDLRENWAIKSFQEELVYRGFDPGTYSGIYDRATYRAVVNFQKTRGINADGKIGSVTSRKLFTKRMNELTVTYGLAPKVLCGLVTQESGFDPAAVGFVNPSDRGLVQINASAHPDVSDEYAFTAQSALQWGAERLSNAYEYFSSKTSDESLAWKCAIANHNSPADAKAWVTTGSPPDEQIANYVARILQHCGAEV